MKLFFYSILLLIAVVVEATSIPIPLTLFGIILLGIFQKKEWVFFLATVAGFLLDSLTFRFFGSSALFFLCTSGVLFLYQKKFETHHMLFGILFTSLSCVVYLLCFTPGIFFPALGNILCLSVLTYGVPFALEGFRTKTKNNFIL